MINRSNLDHFIRIIFSDLVKRGQLIVTQLQLGGISYTVEGILGDVFQLVVAQIQQRDVDAILKGARLYLGNFVAG